MYMEEKGRILNRNNLTVINTMTMEMEMERKRLTFRENYW